MSTAIKFGLAWGLAPALATAVLTAMALRAATRLGLFDPLEARRLHRVPTPRGGGLGIALVLAAGLALQGQWLIMAGLLVCAGAGLRDDLRPLAPLPKLLAQLVSAALLGLALPVPGWDPLAGSMLAGLWTLALVNVWNFMDGSDGMAAVQALLVAAGLGLLGAGAGAWLLAAACLGFLPFNLPRARIFLGDVGSHSLGYGAAMAGLQGLHSAALGPILLPVMCSAFLLDTGWTLARRLYRREPFWQAHAQHLYQRAIRNGFGHGKVCLAYAAWTALAVLLALAASGRALAWQGGVLAATAATGSVAYWMLFRRWSTMDAAVGEGSP